MLRQCVSCWLLIQRLNDNIHAELGIESTLPGLRLYSYIELHSLFYRAVRKVFVYANRLVDAVARLPKRYLAGPTVRLVGPRILGPKALSFSESRDKPHILILRNKFYSRPSDQPSTEEFHLDHTLTASKLATFEVLTYDHDLLISPLSDLQLIAKCQDIRPDAIVLSSWWLAPRQPSIDSLKFIREKLGIRIAAIWWDTCSDTFWRALQPLMKQFDAHVIIDNPSLHYIDQGDPFSQRILPLWPPQDESLFFPGVTRDIPVSFLGQVSSYRSYRSEVIDYLIDRQIPGQFLTNDRHKQVSHAVYADVMRRSKISLNFSYSVSCQQLKSRVLEVMLSGAMLLESENDQTSQLFTPMKDYVPFGSKEDLVDRIRYYLRNENEMMAIARQGRLTAIKNYSSDRFWRLLLGKLELIDSE